MIMILTQIYTVLQKPLYLLLAVTLAVGVFSFAVWLPNLALIGTILGGEGIPFGDKLRFLLSFYGSIATNFTLVSATYTILIAILFGVNTALLAYYFKRVRGSAVGIKRIHSVGLGGLISGFFGIGCAACGTFLLTSVLTLFGAGGLLVYLPFGGEEFGFLGVGLLFYALYATAQKLANPLVCRV